MEARTLPEIILSLTRNCDRVLDDIEDLEFQQIYKHKLKQKVTGAKKECSKFTDEQLVNNPEMVQVFDNDLLLESKLKDLSMSERQAVSIFIDKLITLRDGD